MPNTKTGNTGISKAIAANVLLESLASHGVDYFFANPGTDFPSIVEAFAEAQATGSPSPRPILVTHENVAVSMAHGAALMTGQAQAVMVHTIVGTGNTLNALTNANRERVPLLLMAGRTPITQEGHHGSRSFTIHWAQEMYDQSGLVRELVKWDYELRFPGQVDEVIDRALEIASAAPQGPVYLALPRETLAQPARARKSAPRIADRRLLHPDPAAVSRLAEWIAAAQRPLIITSSVGRSEAAVALLDTLAERHAIAVTVPAQRYLALRTDHPMHLGYRATELLRDADLVLVIESDVPWIPAQGGPAAGARVVHIGEDPSFAEIPIRRFPSDLSLTASASVTLAALLDALGEPGPAVADRRAYWAGRAKALRDSVEAERRRAGESRHITPALVADTLGRLIDADAIVFNEYSMPVQHLPRTRPGSYFGLPASGGLGWGLGAALGARLAAPDKLVIATLGDGAYVFNNPAACHWVSTAHQLPVLTLVFNNARYGAVAYATAEMYHNGESARDGWRMLADLEPSPAYEKFCEASGGHGERVADPAELEAALRRAIDVVVKEKRQALLNIICS